MIPLSITLGLSLFFFFFYIIFTLKYKAYLEKLDLLKTEEIKEFQLHKYITDDKKEVMKQKLKQVSQIIKDTEEEIERTVSTKLKSIESQSTQTLSNEDELIEEAGKDYNIYMAGLMSAIPKTKEELKQDIENLEEAIKKLESYDKSYYESESKEVNIGASMFYEKMSRKFSSIIKEHNLDDNPIIPIQRLKYHAFSEIKGIKENDFLPIIELMKTTKLIMDVIEINANFHILSFFEDSLKLSNAEKVLLAFAYEFDTFSVQKLLELTEWDFKYADRILNQLQEKELIITEGENIIVKGYGSFAERSKWNTLINSFISQESEKEESRLKRQLELKSKLKSSLEQVKEKKEELVKLEDKIIVPEQKESLEEEIPKKEFKGKPKVKPLPQSEVSISKEKKADLKLPLDFESIEKEDSELSEKISQKVLDFHEKYSVINGGLCQYERLRAFLIQEMQQVSEEDLKAVLNNLIELKLISKSLKIGKSVFYLFKDLKFSSKEKSFIKYAINKSPLKKVEFKKGLKWNEEDVLNVMKSLQKKSILRIESDKVIIPGIVQAI